MDPLTLIGFVFLGGYLIGRRDGTASVSEPTLRAPETQRRPVQSDDRERPAKQRSQEATTGQTTDQTTTGDDVVSARKGPATAAADTAAADTAATDTAAADTAAADTAAADTAAARDASAPVAQTTLPLAAEPARPERAPSKRGTEGDDLEQINGIGPVYARRLRKAGILYFKDLLQLDGPRIQEIVKPRVWGDEQATYWHSQAKKLSGLTADDEPVAAEPSNQTAPASAETPDSADAQDGGATGVPAAGTSTAQPATGASTPNGAIVSPKDSSGTADADPGGRPDGDGQIPPPPTQ